MNFLIDTNFVLRYLLEDNPSQFNQANSFFDKVSSGNIKAILEQTVFTEIIFVLSHHYQTPRAVITETLSNFIMLKGIIYHDKQILLDALNIFKDSNFHIVDCLLLAKSKLYKIKVQTFDSEMNKYLKEND